MVFIFSGLKFRCLSIDCIRFFLKRVDRFVEGAIDKSTPHSDAVPEPEVVSLPRQVPPGTWEVLQNPRAGANDALSPLSARNGFGGVRTKECNTEVQIKGGEHKQDRKGNALQGRPLQGQPVTGPGSPGQMGDRTDLRPSAYGRN